FPARNFITEYCPHECDMFRVTNERAHFGHVQSGRDAMEERALIAFQLSSDQFMILSKPRTSPTRSLTRRIARSVPWIYGSAPLPASCRIVRRSSFAPNIASTLMT